MRIRHVFELLAASALLVCASPGVASASGSGAATRSAAHYEIIVTTGVVDKAGTNGVVKIQLEGTLGDSKWLPLDNTDNNFENGSVDRFSFMLPGLGTITGANLSFKPKGFNSGWFLADVKVKGPGGTTTFPVNEWLLTETIIHLTP